MFANIELKKNLGEGIVVRWCHIDTGIRKIVFVKYQLHVWPREVKTAHELEHLYCSFRFKCRRRVVTSAHFLIDAKVSYSRHTKRSSDPSGGPSGHSGHKGSELDYDWKNYFWCGKNSKLHLLLLLYWGCGTLLFKKYSSWCYPDLSETRSLFHEWMAEAQILLKSITYPLVKQWSRPLKFPLHAFFPCLECRLFMSFLRWHRPLLARSQWMNTLETCGQLPQG